MRVVALRKESVDRNIILICCSCFLPVALRKESVDRNCESACITVPDFRSLSARRAWIEISSLISSNIGNNVALRKESVDRNERIAVNTVVSTPVALRKESVDRNDK